MAISSNLPGLAVFQHEGKFYAYKVCHFGSHLPLMGNILARFGMVLQEPVGQHTGTVGLVAPSHESFTNCCITIIS